MSCEDNSALEVDKEAWEEEGLADLVCCLEVYLEEVVPGGEGECSVIAEANDNVEEDEAQDKDEMEGEQDKEEQEKEEEDREENEQMEESEESTAFDLLAHHSVGQP
ncbi:uncharacterized protein EDB93DRAFT_1100249 [Suillus bovinus]|uniref:uncharacterized protein n=1 Tax=Suillus bovinus TaxID=48563 RepID=UPI001B85F289|nr:uncharacterized protein EDB93DRAFT_1100249 [Suillus bovinus]KAG2158581.1 hypothetical protein EDB93DRAFT_1100249 [Suillus bovinus]